MLDAWRRHSEDLATLLLSSRGVGDVILVREDDPRRVPILRPLRGVKSGPGMSLAMRSAQAGGRSPDSNDEEQLARLLALGGGLSRRLDATVAAHWRDRLLNSDAETDRLHARLHAALYGRVLATLGGWLGQREPSLTLEVADETASPTLQSDSDGAITAVLPFGWLVDVWARGLDVVWGRFCLSAATVDGHEWELLTVGPDLGTPTRLKITHSG
jgi:hypothetical protein